MSINRNIAFLGSVTIVFVSLAAVVALWGIYSLNDAFVSLHQYEITTKIETIKINRDVNYVSRLTRNIMLGSDYDDDMQELEEIAGTIADSFNTLTRASHSVIDQKLVEQARIDTAAFVDNCIQRMKWIKDIPAKQRNNAYKNYRKEATPLAMKSRASFRAIIQNADLRFDMGNKQFEKTIHRTLTIIAVAGILIAVFFQLSIRRYKERRMEEAALRKVHQELEQRITERTAELVTTNSALLEKIKALKTTEHILRESRDNAVHAGKLAVLGQMSAGVSHEINQPLTAIHTLTDNAVNLLELGRVPEALENLGVISRMTDRIGSIVAEIKSFSRKAPVEKQAISIINAINHARMLVEPQRGQLGAILEVQPFQETLQVWADLVRFEQVLVNLLRNSLDAVSKQSDKRVTVTIMRHESEVHIIISDTGAGIAKEILPHLFEAFVTSKPSGQGVGLGLAISHMIITELGGKLTAQNPDAGGAEFTIVLKEAVDGLQQSEN
ncbi:MAG: GHKL domain-containing protein [Desulfuromusa sp.]|nr:GHKL domain-containing protein [Desulfuromusa sp.]